MKWYVYFIAEGKLHIFSEHLSREEARNFADDCKEMCRLKVGNSIDIDALESELI